MSKYTLTIEGDFEKGDCLSCPLLSQDNGYGVECYRAFEDCPLEEATVAKNATVEGEWIDNIVERLEAATESVYNEVKGDYFDYIKTADAIEIVKGSKDEGILI